MYGPAYNGDGVRIGNNIMCVIILSYQVVFEFCSINTMASYVLNFPILTVHFSRNGLVCCNEWFVGDQPS